MSKHTRALALHRPRRNESPAEELHRLREAAERRYTEVDLHVAALKEHIRDLQVEREALLAEVGRLREEAARDDATWLWRGLKPPR
ncbi:MAG: hypothetical protein IT303_09660 [Dehalococcoidia bacterium]|nr:hypothetical protein [Dehalococcoidia bacterium]